MANTDKSKSTPAPYGHKIALFMSLSLSMLLTASEEGIEPADAAHRLVPNVIVIVLDTVRQSATSLARPSAGTTPYLETLARKGVVYENAFSTFDSTPESHFSIFTGLKKGLMSRRDRQDHSLAYHLNDIGYDTVGVSANFNVRKEAMRTVRPFNRFLSPARNHLSLLPAPLQAAVKKDASHRIHTFQAKYSSFNRNINENSAKTINGLLDMLLPATRKPALVFANFLDAHDPYFPPERFHDAESESPPEGFASDLRARPLPDWMTDPETIDDPAKRSEFIARLKTVRNRKWNLSDDLSEAALGIYEKRYREEIAALDDELTRTIGILEKHGFLKNSLVVITSDHGESFGEKGYITHSMRNRGDKETSRHVPLLMVPMFKEDFAARRVTRPVSIADIAPTIYDLLGIDDSPFSQKFGKDYGKSLISDLDTKKETGVGHRAAFDTAADAPQDDGADEALIESLKALGYITED